MKYMMVYDLACCRLSARGGGEKFPTVGGVLFKRHRRRPHRLERGSAWSTFVGERQRNPEQKLRCNNL